MNIVFFGPPCSGKGTQAIKLSKVFDLSIIDAGFLLRNSKFYNNIKGDIEKGKLLDDNIVIDLVTDAISLNNGKGFILDGYPRSLNQVLAMNDFKNNYNIDINLIIHFEIEQSKILERTLSRRICGDCGALIMPGEEICHICSSHNLIKRIDDVDASVVKYRISQYYQNRDEIMKNFVHQVVTIDAGFSIDEVFKQISVSLDRINS